MAEALDAALRWKGIHCHRVGGGIRQWQDAAMFPRAVWLLFIGTLINRFGGFVLVFLILYLTRSGFSAAQAGLAVGAYGVGGIAAALIGGFLADRIGRRGSIALSMVSAAIAIVALER